MTVYFLPPETVIFFHDMVVEQAKILEEPTDPRPHVNTQLLESGVNAPQNLYHYGGDDIDLFDLATSLIYALSKNHAFVDGNKRTAKLSGVMFLDLNHDFRIAQETSFPDIHFRIEELVRGTFSKDDMARFLRNTIVLRPLDPD